MSIGPFYALKFASSHYTNMSSSEKKLLKCANLQKGNTLDWVNWLIQKMNSKRERREAYPTHGHRKIGKKRGIMNKISQKAESVK